MKVGEIRLWAPTVNGKERRLRGLNVGARRYNKHITDEPDELRFYVYCSLYGHRSEFFAEDDFHDAVVKLVEMRDKKPRSDFRIMAEYLVKGTRVMTETIVVHNEGEL